MIKHCKEEDREQVLTYLKQDHNINLFAIGDIENFGFDVDFQDVYVNEIDHDIDSVLVRYKENILYYSHTNLYNPIWNDFIQSMPHKFVSAKEDLSKQIRQDLTNYRQKTMYFSALSEVLVPLDYDNVIDVKSDQDIGLVYDLLQTIHEFEGFKDRTKEEYIESTKQALAFGKTYMVKEDGICVATASTVADTSVNAMVVAVATHKDYRHKGYATSVMLHLIDEYINNRKKSLCLFYDNPKAGKIYKRLGFKDIDQWTMLIKE
jgi:predicted GNAT family acetyltransferase